MPVKKEKKIHKAAKDLFIALDASAQLKLLTDGSLIYKNKLIPEAQKQRIIDEAKVILALEFWDILMDDMKQVACRKMYEDATDEELIVGGKWMLFTLDVLNKKLYNLSKLKIKNKPTTKPSP